MKKVCIIGLGYIGLPTAIVLADNGFNVIGFDIDASRVARLAAGDPVIQEPEIAQRLASVLAQRTFYPTTTISQADYFIVAVPTPFKEGKKADLSYVNAAIAALSTVLKSGNVVIIESTIPVGTTTAVAHHLQELTGLVVGKNVFVAHCPERVLPGKIFYELVHNPRIIGGAHETCMHAAKELYKPFVKADLYLTDATTAEMVKLVENSSRDVQIAFAHQVASMASATGLNPYEVIELANKHPRVQILNPSCGVGGHCIAVDPWFLVETFGRHTHLLKAAREVNDEKPFEIIRILKKAIYAWRATHQGTCTLALLGATYKPNVDDLRESPALHIMQIFARWHNLNLLVVEPHVGQEQLSTLVGTQNVVSYDEALRKSDIVVYLVAHTLFKTFNPVLLAYKEVFDFCGILHQPKDTFTGQEHLFWPAQTAPRSLAMVRSAPSVTGKECT
jgi:UDP-N-acetyl-D-mannosaminuronic acid dehydrogenase